MLSVRIGGRPVGHQRFRMLAPGVALRITAFGFRADAFELHARKLLAHTELQAIAWVNIHHTLVTFTVLR